ncbi:MAG: hypothetical protein HQ551_05830 [Desulfobacteraceae bacterium]|nr:hypothetical protein [Desulfobacteraceae bacterium]
MNKSISILLVGLLGFLGCSGSDAGTSPYTVQAFGLADGSGLSVSAYVMDQEENLSSDAMLTINDEPMNIGFFAAEDLNMDQEDSLPDAINHTVRGVPSGDYQPFYFLDSVALNEGDTANFVARGRDGSTLYSSSAVVPEKITIIEPSGDEPLPAGEPVVVRWEGGAPCSQFRVIYYRGSDGEMFTSGMIQGRTEFIMPAHWIDAGWGEIFVEGCDAVGEDDQNENESGFEMRAAAEIYIELALAVTATGEAAGANRSSQCIRKCNNSFEARRAMCTRYYNGGVRRMCLNNVTFKIYACHRGCDFCTR